MKISKKKNLLCIACISAILLIPIVPVSKAETGEIVPVIIKYKYPPTAEHIEYIESLGQVKYVYDIIPAIGGFIYDYDIDDVESLDDVEEVELGQTVHTMLAQSRTIVKADQVQALGVDGNGVRICIVDTGVDDSHPDLNPLVAEIDFVNNDNDATDDRGHGTHVAGIASSIDTINRGIAPGASLMAAKVLDVTGSGSTLDIVAGIEWCTEGPDGFLNTADDADIISMSLGTSFPFLFSDQASCDSQAITQASNNAVTLGKVVVAASGNDGLQGLSAPGCGLNLIGVGATANNDSIAAFSNGGPLLDVVAPGVAITSTVPTGICAHCHPSGFNSLSGTSMATPHVSGVAALLLQTDPTLTPTQVRTAIENNALDLGAPGFDFIFGHGRIDALASQQSVAQPDITPPTFTITANPDPANAEPVSVDVIASESLNGVPTVSVKQAGQLTATSVTMTGTGNTFSGTYTVVTEFDGIADISVSGSDLASNVGTGLSSFVVDTQIPSVTVTNPTQGSTISGLITITATASDNLAVSKVDFFVDGNLLSSDSLAPFNSSFDTTTVANGAHTISADAHDTAGNTNIDLVTVTVQNAVSPLTVDSVSSTSSNRAPVFSWSHTTGSGTDRLLVVGISIGDSSATVTSITYGGTALTKLRSDVNINADTATELWYLINPASGSTNIRVTMGDKGSTIGGSISFKGAAQTATFSNNVGAIGTGTPASVVVASATDEMVVSTLAIFRGDGSATPESGHNEHWDLTGKKVEGAGSTAPGTTSVTMSWTKDDNDWAISAVSIKPATVGPPPPPNASPVLALIGNQNVDEGLVLNLVLSATDADTAAASLTFSETGLPAFGTLGLNNGDGTANLDFTPGFADSGSYPITITVSDGDVTTADDSETFTLTVTDSPQAPVLGAIGAQTVAEGGTLTVTITATDADTAAASLSFSATGVPAGFATFANNGDGTATLQVDPGFADAGVSNIVVTVSDGDVATADDSETFTLTVTDSPQAPVLGPIGAQTVAEGGTLTVTITATDADTPLTSLIFSQTGVPAFASLTDNLDGTATLQANPVVGDAGVSTITITVSDGDVTTADDSELFTLTVNSVGQAPVLALIGNQNVDEGLVLNLVLSATDADTAAASLTFSETGLPAFGTLGLNNGDGTANLDFTPGFADSGSYPITITVSDGDVTTADDSELFTLTVTDSPQAPVLGAIGNQVVVEGGSLTVTIMAADADTAQASLRYSETGVPIAFASFTDNLDGTATLQVDPGFADAGVSNIVVTVSDGDVTTADDSETFILTVTDSPQAPVLGPIGAQTVAEGDTLTVTITATDADTPLTSLIFSQTGVPAFASLTDNLDGTATLQANPVVGDAGVSTITVTVTDQDLLTDSETFTLTVNPAQPSDVVIIERAEFRADKGELRVRATSTDFTATLSVYNENGFDPLVPLDNLIGEMVSDGLGNYELRLENVANPGATITVISSSGGSDTQLL